ncbi:uncharacterized protein F5Z01DRAFT_672703 [Emericellopsis atlantica]|uniref:SH3 domain-containing protein n=1 Tax=Emericellopsis atlantica TaxID=2614577 RepID=A0A9P7ZQ59_9HYPO|nr:uncharacterized protein F5Z01DRAFT_672703 [Emericellopsis atlantica]KAG9256061.1 hypothetical protein F5Z01DRAFT_672703 [Emericellopsis atlantica]
MASDAPTATSPRDELASQSNQDSLTLPPQMTSPNPQQPTRARPLSHASRSRLSQYSASSIPTRSRPVSHAFPIFTSSLPYSLVRDFAYGSAHPLHYGPPPEPSGPPSGMTTPASEHKRFSDPPMAWDSWTVDGFNRGYNIPPIQPGDGPPYSEDEDLQSPVVSTRHRKHKSTSAALGGPAYGTERGYYIDSGPDGSERYYVDHGLGGEYVSYPPGEVRHSRAYHFAQQPQHGHEAPEGDSSPPSPAFDGPDESRYSRDYQFTITSPDEEFHGKAVALFDFARENENELPLVEGQVIWVSYRHGQGWLVAEDPKTQESGLVPEEYVRLLRDIEGGMTSLTGQVGDGFASPNDVPTPTQPEHTGQCPPPPAQGNGANGYHQPVLSVFSTSSKDLNPYPTGQLGLSTGQAPPQVVHYHGQRGGSRANTPTLAQHEGLGRRESQDTGSGQDAAAPLTER